MQEGQKERRNPPSIKSTLFIAYIPRPYLSSSQITFFVFFADSQLQLIRARIRKGVMRNEMQKKTQYIVENHIPLHGHCKAVD